MVGWRAGREEVVGKYDCNPCPAPLTLPRRHRDLLYTSRDFGVSYGFMYEDYNRASYFWVRAVQDRGGLVPEERRTAQKG